MRSSFHGRHRNTFPITCWRAADNQIKGKWRWKEPPIRLDGDVSNSDATVPGNRIFFFKASPPARPHLEMKRKEQKRGGKEDGTASIA